MARSRFDVHLCRLSACSQVSGALRHSRWLPAVTAVGNGLDYRVAEEENDSIRRVDVVAVDFVVIFVSVGALDSLCAVTLRDHAAPLDTRPSRAAGSSSVLLDDGDQRKAYGKAEGGSLRPGHPL